jgi:hypothetical protein
MSPADTMSRQTSTTAKPLPLVERKARLRALVESGKLSEQQARLTDLRELTPREKAHAETLAKRAHRKAA